MNDIQAGSVLRRGADVRYRVIEDEGVVVRQGAGEVLVLNDLGTRILVLADGATPVAGWIEVLLAEYEVERARSFYAQAASALPAEDRAAMVCAEAMRSIYHALLERIACDGCDVIGRRYRLSTPRKLYLVGRTWAGTRLRARIGRSGTLICVPPRPGYLTMGGGVLRCFTSSPV